MLTKVLSLGRSMSSVLFSGNTSPPSTTTWLQTAKTAGLTLIRVLRNAGFSILVGWLSGFVYTLGNVASGEPPAEQPYASYVTANGLWFHGMFSATMVAMYALRLTPEKFVARSRRKAPEPTEPESHTLTLLQCSLKLLWYMAPYLVFSTAAEIVGCYMLISHLPESKRKYKPGMYMNSFWSNFVLASAEYCTRSIFNAETVRGLTRRQLRDSGHLGQQGQQDNKPRPQHHPSRRRYSRMSSIRRFLLIYLQTLPGIVSSLIAIVYVHSISLFATIDRETELLAFAIGSIALKLTLQEAAKRHLLSTKEPLPRRAMIVLISTPTILVDTQVRMLLMRLQDVTISVLGSALLALAEISVRALKSMVVHRQVHNILKHRVAPTFAKARRRATVTQTPNALLPEQTPVEPVAKRRTTSPARPATDETEAQRQRHLVVHAAEIYADMYAEYMAMGCSYAIMFFFWNHPQYQFLSKAAAASKSESTQQLHYFLIFAFQVSVEVAVDFVACNVEAMQGVDFGSFDQNDPFLTFFMSMLAFANVSISAGLYIHS